MPKTSPCEKEKVALTHCIQRAKGSLSCQGLFKELRQCHKEKPASTDPINTFNKWLDQTPG